MEKPNVEPLRFLVCLVHCSAYVPGNILMSPKGFSPRHPLHEAGLPFFAHLCLPGSSLPFLDGSPWELGAEEIPNVALFLHLPGEIPTGEGVSSWAPRHLGPKGA